MKDEKILSQTQSILLGGSVGVAQTVSSLPFWTIKTRVQCKYPFTMEPRVLYQGFTIATLSITLMSTSQFFFSSLAHRFFYANPNGVENNSTQRVLSACIGGVVSTIISNPVGIIITQQHKHKNRKIIDVASNLVKVHGIKQLYTSFFCNGIVNGAFTIGFYGLWPIVNESYKSYFNNEILVSAYSGITTGLAVGIVSQPFDMIKAIQEKNADIKKIGVSKCFQEIYSKRRVVGFYSGFIPASISTGVAIAVAGLSIEKFGI